MTRAPRLVGAAFGISVALAILLTGPLLLFNPWFISLEQARHNVPGVLGASPGDVDRLTWSLVSDLFTGGAFDARPPPSGCSVCPPGPRPYLTDDERSHMADVGGVVRSLLAVELVALIAIVLAGRRLRGEPRRRGMLLVGAAGVIGSLAVVAGITFAFAFDVAFAAFHALFFAAGTWQFAPGTPLITLFPEPFWFDVALVAGATVVVVAIAVALIGRRDLERADRQDWASGAERLHSPA